MTYEVVVTFTKTPESPADAFSTMPVLNAGVAGITQEQIDSINELYPMTVESRVVLNQRIIHYTFPSKAEFDGRELDPAIAVFREQRRVWAEANNITVDIRVL
jgi:hypothetical protein